MHRQTFKITAIACRPEGTDESFYDFTESLIKCVRPELIFVIGEKEALTVEGRIWFSDPKAASWLGSSKEEKAMELLCTLERSTIKESTHIVSGSFHVKESANSYSPEEALYILDFEKSSLRGSDFDLYRLGWGMAPNGNSQEAVSRL